MEDRALRKSREMPSEEQSKDEPLIKPLQPAEASTRNPPSEQEESPEEEELTNAPTTRGRTSWEL